MQGWPGAGTLRLDGDEHIGALHEGDGGLADIKKILAQAAGHLSGGGVLALECGLGQAEKAAASFADFGFAGAETFKDASKRVRFAIFRARG